MTANLVCFHLVESMKGSCQGLGGGSWLQVEGACNDFAY